MKYKLEKKPGAPLYEVLYEGIRNDILTGRIHAGERLPSKRELAESNQISLTTVLNAYQQLMIEGYVYSEEKRGYFVSNIQAIPPVPKTAAEEFKYYQEDQWFADFRANHILYHHFPFSTWKKVLREVLSIYEMELVVRGNPFGIEELRMQIAEYLYRARGINVSPECIIIGAGIEYLYGRLITMFHSGTVYGVENPGYQKIPDIYKVYNTRWRSIEMASDGINMADLLVKDVDIIHVSPEHHYPLGTIMPMQKRQELLRWAEEAEDRYIIEDDFDCEFRYHSKPIPAMKSMDVSGKVIYMNTFSKTLSPAVRISYMVLPESLLERYVQSTHFFTNSTSSLEQYTLSRFIEKGYFERHINRIKKLYRHKGESLFQMIRGESRIPVKNLSGVESGTHLLIQLDTRLSDAEVKRRAVEKGIHVGFLTDFCTHPNPRYDHTLILNFPDLEEDVQLEAVRRIGDIFCP